MRSKSLKILCFVALASLPATGFAQNYLGYSKQYILKAIKTQHRDMKGPVIVKGDDDNYVLYSTRDGRRAIIYHFESMPVTLDNGKQVETEICVKYYSKNKCLDYTNCPLMDQVMQSLDSHFDKGGTYLQWIDNSKRNPQEWMLVRDDDYFEVHVMELKK